MKKNSFIILVCMFLVYVQVGFAWQNDSGGTIYRVTDIDQNKTFTIDNLYAETISTKLVCGELLDSFKDFQFKNIEYLRLFGFCYPYNGHNKTQVEELEKYDACSYYLNIFNNYSMHRVKLDGVIDEEEKFSKAVGIFKSYCPKQYAEAENNITMTKNKYRNSINELKKIEAGVLAQKRIADIQPNEEFDYFKKFVNLELYDKAIELMNKRFNRVGSNDIETLAEFRYGLDNTSDNFKKLALNNVIKSIEFYRQKYPSSNSQILTVDDAQMNKSVCEATASLLKQKNFADKYGFNTNARNVNSLCSVLGNIKFNTDIYFKTDKPFIGVDAKNSDMLLVCLWNKKYKFDTIASSNGHSLSLPGFIDMFFNAMSNGSPSLKKTLSELHYTLDSKMLSQGVNYLVVIVYEKELLLPKNYSNHKKDVSFSYDYSVAFNGMRIQARTLGGDEELRVGAKIRHYKVIPFNVEIGPFDSIKASVLDSVPINDEKTIKQAISKLDDRLKKTAGSVVLKP